MREQVSSAGTQTSETEVTVMKEDLVIRLQRINEESASLKFDQRMRKWKNAEE